MHTSTNRLPARLGIGRMLEHQRTLQVAGAVQPRRQAEVSLEQRAGAAEPLEDGIGGNGGHLAEYTFCTSEPRSGQLRLQT